MLNKENKGKKKLIMPIFLGLIMVLSIIGYSISSGTESLGPNDLGTSYTYNGREYIKTQQGWAVNIGQGFVAFSYGPKELEGITIPDFTLGNKIYIAYDPNNKDQNIDFIIQKLNNALLYLNIRPVNSCTIDSINCPNIPIVNCNLNDKAITIEKQEKLEITKDNNCLHIKGSALDLDKVSDKLVMKWLGLI